MLIDHLEELEKQDFENKEIIVVDNGSSDNTSNLIRQKFPNINLITLKENTSSLLRGIIDQVALSVNRSTSLLVLA